MRHFLILALVLAVALTLVSFGWTQSGGGHDISFNTIDGGGYMYSTGGGFELGGTIGQPDAGLLTGGAYALQGGFWVSGLSARTFARTWMLYP